MKPVGIIRNPGSALDCNNYAVAQKSPIFGLQKSQSTVCYIQDDTSTYNPPIAPELYGPADSTNCPSLPAVNVNGQSVVAQTGSNLSFIAIYNAQTQPSTSYIGLQLVRNPQIGFFDQGISESIVFITNSLIGVYQDASNSITKNVGPTAITAGNDLFMECNKNTITAKYTAFAIIMKDDASYYCVMMYGTYKNGRTPFYDLKTSSLTSPLKYSKIPNTPPCTACIAKTVSYTITDSAGSSVTNSLTYYVSSISSPTTFVAYSVFFSTDSYTGDTAGLILGGGLSTGTSYVGSTSFNP
jgi:hypothetical protein